MSILGLKFPDFSDHPPPPQLTFEEYQQWVCGDIIPELTRRGEMTEEKLIADFMNNEGRVTEWPDFGALGETRL
jgi:CobQ-like glutamine amidotransferase family enzyme